MWMAQNKGDSGDPDLIWREAQADFRAQRYDRAAAALGRLRRLRAPTALDWMLKAQLAMVGNRNDEALDYLARVADSEMMGPQARLLAGQLELRRNRVTAAEKDFLAAIKLDPTLVQAHRELIYIYGMQLRRPELNLQFRALAKLTPLTFDNAFHWCLTRNTIWEPREMVRTLSSYIQADPDDRWSRLALAENLLKLGRRDDAESVLDVLGPADPDAKAIGVKLALERGDDQAAEALLTDIPADHAELNRLKGRFALAHRDGEAAVRFFRAARAAEPDHRDAIFGLGQALEMVGDHAAALPLLNAARDIDALNGLVQRAATSKGREDPALLRALGLACERARRYPEARAWLSLAIDANPLDAEAQKALFRVKSLDSPDQTEPRNVAGTTDPEPPRE
jgi:tetratricopeptide (TPR) repeat protein